jgi:hypothetical protein
MAHLIWNPFLRAMLFFAGWKKKDAKSRKNNLCGQTSVTLEMPQKENVAEANVCSRV